MQILLISAGSPEAFKEESGSEFGSDEKRFKLGSKALGSEQEAIWKRQLPIAFLALHNRGKERFIWARIAL